MDQNDRQAIEGLFANLATVEQQSGPRDGEADRFISERIATQPGAPYFMAQTIVVQEQALLTANDRIEQLEQELASQSPQRGGFLSSLFGGGGSPAQARRPQPSSQPQQASSPWARQPMTGQATSGAGGGFLAGAAQTAMGVAGGVMLGNAIGSMFGGNEAKAAEPAKPEEKEEDTGADDDEGIDLGF
ncbi:MAG: hypothetical protein JWM58_865 [Rhizobium sp.]|nr:hypothetical protein [Rhizobium sp.]